MDAGWWLLAGSFGLDRGIHHRSSKKASLRSRCGHLTRGVERWVVIRPNLSFAFCLKKSFDAFILRILTILANMFLFNLARLAQSSRHIIMVSILYILLWKWKASAWFFWLQTCHLVRINRIFYFLSPFLLFFEKIEGWRSCYFFLLFLSVHPFSAPTYKQMPMQKIQDQSILLPSIIQSSLFLFVVNMSPTTADYTVYEKEFLDRLTYFAAVDNAFGSFFGSIL